MKDETIAGFLTTTTSSGQTKGILARPVVMDENLIYLPAMLGEVSGWMMQKGNTAVQMATPDEREQLGSRLENAGWVKRQSGLRLVKWLK